MIGVDGDVGVWAGTSRRANPWTVPGVGVGIDEDRDFGGGHGIIASKVSTDPGNVPEHTRGLHHHAREGSGTDRLCLEPISSNVGALGDVGRLAHTFYYAKTDKGSAYLLLNRPGPPRSTAMATECPAWLRLVPGSLGGGFFESLSKNFGIEILGLIGHNLCDVGRDEVPVIHLGLLSSRKVVQKAK